MTHETGYYSTRLSFWYYDADKQKAVFDTSYPCSTGWHPATTISGPPHEATFAEATYHGMRASESRPWVSPDKLN
jgi:hypothetical protein